MKDNINDFLEKFDTIKKMGWVKTHRTGDTGIGKTFEDLLDKEEDNYQEPDYKGIEIKSQRLASSSLITLFTKSPSKPRGANTYLRETFGSCDNNYGLNTLHTTVNARYFNTFKNYYGFKIDIDYNSKNLFLVVKNLNTNEILSRQVYWTFCDIENCLNHKLKYIAYVSAEEKKENDGVYFKYTHLDLITGIRLENFLNALENGDLFVDIRIGVYPNGNTHDHGTAFRISYESLMHYGTVLESTT